MSLAFPLTERQQEVLRVIRHACIRDGYPPTMRAAAAELGMISAANIQRHIYVLVEHGLLEYRPHKGGEYWPTPTERQP